MNKLILTNLVIGRNPLLPLDLKINYCFDAGNIYYIFGDNGSGKTTFMRTLCHYLTPISGSISIKNTLFSCAYYGHNNALKNNMLVYDYLNFCFKIFDNTHNFNELIDIFNIKPLLYIPISYLSCGQKKCISLVAFLFCDRNIYCFDEASSGLDVNYKAIYYNYLTDLTMNKQKIIIFSDHTNPNLNQQKTVNLHDFTFNHQE